MDVFEASAVEVKQSEGDEIELGNQKDQPKTKGTNRAEIKGQGLAEAVFEKDTELDPPQHGHNCRSEPQDYEDGDFPLVGLQKLVAALDGGDGGLAFEEGDGETGSGGVGKDGKDKQAERTGEKAGEKDHPKKTELFAADGAKGLPGGDRSFIPDFLSSEGRGGEGPVLRPKGEEEQNHDG